MYKIKTISALPVAIFMALVIFFPTNTYCQKVNRIIDALICPFEQNDFLLVHQSVFEPVSRSYEQGNLRSSGFNISQLLVYDLKNGQLIAQKDLGKISVEEYTQILGYSKGVVWAYSLMDKKGFISFKISDLDSKNTYGLFMVNRDFKNQFIRCGVKELLNYFAFDLPSNRLIFSDTLKNQFAFDPEKYTPVKTTFKYYDAYKQRDFLTQSAYFDNDQISINNGNINTVKVNNIDAFDIRKFPESALIKFGIKQDKLDFLQRRIDDCKNNAIKYSNKIDSILSINGASKNELDQIATLSTKNSKKLSYYQNAMKLLDYNDTTEILLRNNKDYFYMISNAPAPHAGTVMITAFGMNGGKLSQVWQTIIDGVLYLTYKSRTGSNLQKMIENSEPDFGFTYFTVYKDRLIGFYALNYFVLDANTGQIIWRVRN